MAVIWWMVSVSCLVCLSKQQAAASSCCGPGPPPNFELLGAPPLPPSLRELSWKCPNEDFVLTGDGKYTTGSNPNYKHSTANYDNNRWESSTTSVLADLDPTDIRSTSAEQSPSPRTETGGRVTIGMAPAGEVANKWSDPVSATQRSVVAEVTTEAAANSSVTAQVAHSHGLASGWSVGAIVGTTLAILALVAVAVAIVLHMKNKYLRYQVEPEAEERSKLANYLYNYKIRGWSWRKSGGRGKTRKQAELANPSHRTLVKADSEVSVSSSDTGYCEEVLDNQRSENENSLPRSEPPRTLEVKVRPVAPGAAAPRGAPQRPGGGDACTNRPLAVAGGPPGGAPRTASQRHGYPPDIIASAALQTPPLPAEGKRWSLMEAVRLPFLGPYLSSNGPRVSRARRAADDSRVEDPANARPAVNADDDEQSVGGGGTSFLKTLSGMPAWVRGKLSGSTSPGTPPDPVADPGPAPKPRNRTPNIELEVVREPRGPRHVTKKKRTHYGGSGPAEV